MKQTIQFSIPVSITIDTGEPSSLPAPAPDQAPEPEVDPNIAILRAAYLASPPVGFGREPSESELTSGLEVARVHGIETELAAIHTRAAG